MDILEQFERNNKRQDSSSRFLMDNIRQGSLFHGVHIAEELAVPAEEMSSPQRDSQQHWPHSTRCQGSSTSLPRDNSHLDTLRERNM